MGKKEESWAATSGGAWHPGSGYLVRKYSRTVSREAMMEMLQPTREMYVRGTSSSAGSGSWDNCCGREVGLEARRMETPPLGSIGETFQAPHSKPPCPTILTMVPAQIKSWEAQWLCPPPTPISPSSVRASLPSLSGPTMSPTVCAQVHHSRPARALPPPAHSGWLKDRCVTHSRLVGLNCKILAGRTGSEKLSFY